MTSLVLVASGFGYVGIGDVATEDEESWCGCEGSERAAVVASSSGHCEDGVYLCEGVVVNVANW